MVPGNHTVYEPEVALLVSTDYRLIAQEPLFYFLAVRSNYDQFEHGVNI
jgi:hypothetical protein